MAEEKFAVEAAVKDKRVQEMAYDDARLSVKTMTESVAFQPKTAVKEGTKEREVALEDKVKEPSVDELATIEEEAKAIKEDGASSADDKGAAEIIEEVAKKQKEVELDRKAKTKIRYTKSRDMFSSLKLYIVPDAVESPKAHAKMILYSSLKEKFNTYLTSTRGFSGGSIVGSDNLLKAKSTATNAMAAPVQKEVPYGDL